MLAGYGSSRGYLEVMRHAAAQGEVVITANAREEWSSPWKRQRRVCLRGPDMERRHTR